MTSRRQPPPPVVADAGPKGQTLRITWPTKKLTADAARSLARELDKMAEEIDPTPHAEAYRAAAQKHTREGELEVDDGARISAGADDGAYVEAWVWVSMEDAGIATRCEECDAMIPDTPDGVAGGMENKHHDESCSLYNAEKE